MFQKTKVNLLAVASLLLLISIENGSHGQEPLSPDTSSRDTVAPAAIAPQPLSTEANVLQATSGPGVDEVFTFKKLADVSLDIHGSSKRKPESKFTELPVGMVALPMPTVYMWEAPSIEYQPLFFEDPTLERYGQDAGLLTPAVSGAHFFGRILTLPFQAAVRSPFSRDYPLGYGRPGNNNAYLHYQFPW